jgi:hypothetical protein
VPVRVMVVPGGPEVGEIEARVGTGRSFRITVRRAV